MIWRATFSVLLGTSGAVHSPAGPANSHLCLGLQDREFREQQQQLAVSAQDAAQLSETRYRGGAASYLEVLTNETNYFDAELGLAQAQLNELVGLVLVYRNLGGGWQQ